MTDSRVRDVLLQLLALYVSDEGLALAVLVRPAAVRISAGDTGAVLEESERLF